VRTYRFDQVDVFASGPFTGNPLAVIHDAESLSAAMMQTVTRWTNLSEAAFLLAPAAAEADYRVRIFEPKSELPFAGHPTLGACAAWLAAGGNPKRDDVIVQESVDANDLEPVLEVLGIDAADVVDSSWIDNGPGWMGLLLSSARRVLGLPAPTGTTDRFNVGVVGLHPASAGAAVELRAFFNDLNGSIREDPVTGSLNASVAQWLLAMGIVDAPYVAAQTTGRVSVEQADGKIWIGGAAEMRVSGAIKL
jgi:predicted PhzF superfamily epimerase YddE/YHI9